MGIAHLRDDGHRLLGRRLCLVGFMLARRRARAVYQAILTPRTLVWLLGWLVVCFVLTAANVLAIANAAHVAGLAFGYFVGVFANGARRRLAVAGLACLGLGIATAVAYMPWSTAWQLRGLARQFDEWAPRRRGRGRAGASNVRLGSGPVAHDRPQAIPWLRRSAEAGDPVGMNGLAWWLATAPEDTIRNGAEAVRWAEKAYNLTRTPEVADTLAAAYAGERPVGRSDRSPRVGLARRSQEQRRAHPCFQ
jgi:hypothetical protein